VNVRGIGVVVHPTSAAAGRSLEELTRFARARGMPGVLLILTGDDVKAEGLGDVPCVAPLTNRDGTPRHDTPRPVLAIGKVRHAGQPVALVVAEKLYQAMAKEVAGLQAELQKVGERRAGDQPLGLADRGRLVVRRMLERRSDRFGVELPEEDERLGRDPEVGVESLTGAPAARRPLRGAFAVGRTHVSNV